jgi:hypothetical protein
MKYLKIWFEYFSRGRKIFYFVKEVEEGEQYGGIQLHIQIYEVIESSILFLPMLKLSRKEFNFWKPFKINISEEALPNLTEYNKLGKEPFVNVWFEVEKFKDLYDLKIINKIRLDDIQTEILNNLYKNVQK